LLKKAPRAAGGKYKEERNMFDKNSKIVVIGAGGVGGITAALLAKAGYNVKVVCKYPELAEKIKTKGLHIFGLRLLARPTF
jgi:2-polyprenyl-6-methoxyphenol hydroxylase-like FAD-dependent oxidoreductase